MVREYNSKKYLSMPRERSEVIDTPDIGDVCEGLTIGDVEIMKLSSAEIVGVPQLDQHPVQGKSGTPLPPTRPLHQVQNAPTLR